MTVVVPAEMIEGPEYLWSEASPYGPGQRALFALQLARQNVTPHFTAEVTTGEEAELAARFRNPIRYWPSTLPALDLLTRGGFYGLTVVGGKQKLGKTMLGMGSALEAAATRKWQVIYLNAELDSDHLGQRIDEYLTAHPDCLDAAGYLHFLSPGPGFTGDVLVDFALEHVEPDLPLLIVYDSINSLAQLLHSDYLGSLRKLSFWASQARRISCGAASFLVISELNARGGVKGEQLGYWSDLVLRMQPHESDRQLVKIDLADSRSTATGDLGTYRRCIATRRFECLSGSTAEANPSPSSPDYVNELWKM